ncbi:MAG: diguanylate cyclase [Spirochaetes bacterium]|nr:diguanylate cyclase [Spirochaetota bacterium]
MELKIKKDDIIDTRFQIVSRIGEGGMSVVFRARDKEKKTDVAVKFLKPGVTSSYIEDVIRFKREIESVSKLNYPHIVKPFSSGEYHNIPYIVMEYVEGQSMDELFEEGSSFGQRDIISLIKQLSQALDYVHGKGIIHRDLKPGNVMISGKRGGLKAKLLDFGVALMMELGRIKAEEEIVGTFGYMSPEATGIINKQIDERSDLYSLGILFYRLLTGELPFKGKEISKILHQQVAVEPPKISQVKSGVPVVLEDMISKLLFKEPELRYQSAKGLIYDLERFEKGEKDFIVGEKDQKIKLSYQTRLVGRESELNKLKKMFNQARDSKGSICLVAGEPGIGKSRLVEELRGYVYENEGLFFSGRCYDQENKIPYQPFRDAINGYISYVEKMHGQEKETEVKRIKGVLGDLGEIIIRLNGNMGKVLGKVKDLVALDPERENQRFLMVASRFFRHLAPEDRICVLFLDDLQWSDEGSLSLLKEITENIKKSNLLILGTYRNNEVTEDHSLIKMIKYSESKGYPVEAITIERFSHDRMNRLVAQILGAHEERSHRLTDYILQKTGGNTFFAINVIRELVEEKALLWKEGIWLEDWNKIQKIKVSTNMIDVILKRIEELPRDLTDLLCMGSVIGREFEIRLLYHLFPDHSQERIVELIDNAIKIQMLDRSMERGKVLFVHDRIKEAFYQKIGIKLKKSYHLKIAGQIEEIYKDHINDVLFDLAHHYTEGGNKEKSLQYTLPAALKSKDNYANEEAVKYYRLGIRLLEEKKKKNSPEWIKAYEELVEVYLLIGENDEAIKVGKMILPLKKGKIEKARIYRQIGAAWQKKANWELCEETLGKGLALLGYKIPRKKSQVLLNLLLEMIRFFIFYLFPGIFRHREERPIRQEDREILAFDLPLNYMYGLSDLEKCTLSIFSMYNLAERRVGRSNELGIATDALGTVVGFMGMFKLSLKYHRIGLKRNKEIGYQWGTAHAVMFTGIYHHIVGELDKCIEYCQQSLQEYTQMGDMWEIGMSMNMIGHASRYLAQYQQTIENFNSYLDVSQKIKDEYGMSSAMSYLALAYIEMGEFDRAEDLNQKSLHISEPAKILYNVCFGYIHMGYLRAEQGDLKTAIKYYEDAKDLYEHNTFLKDWTCFVYHHLTDAYIEEYRKNKKKYSRKEQKILLKKIKANCHKAQKVQRIWANHYGAALRVTGKYQALKNRKKKAQIYFEKSIKQTQAIGRRYELGRTLYEYGNFLDSTGRAGDAKTRWQKAYEVFNQIGSRHYIRRLEEKLGYKKTAETAEEVTPQDRLKAERKMTTVLGTSRYLSSILDLDELLDKIMTRTIEMVGAERGALFLYPEGKEGMKNLQIRVVKNLGKKDIESESFGTSMSIIKRVTKEQKPLIVEDASMDDAFKGQVSVVRYGLKSVLCAPIMARGNMLGIIYLDNRLVSGLFSQEDLMVLDLISSQAGVSIQNARLYRRAVTDGLTGLYNRIFFDNMLMQSVHEATRYNKPLSLVIIDIDHFKEFNDTYGHQAGDMVLKTVTEKIRTHVRRSDIAARYGGDEFVLILPQTDRDGARMMAEKMREEVEKTKVSYTMGKRQERLNITLSIGIADINEGDDRITFLEKADRALYQAKEQGRNCVVVFGHRRATRVKKKTGVKKKSIKKKKVKKGKHRKTKYYKRWNKR